MIVATGAGATGEDEADGKFTVSGLVDALRGAEGPFAVWCFGLGLYAAAFSSALTVALGAALCCASLLAAGAAEPEWAMPHGRHARAVILGVCLVAFVVGASGAPALPVVLVAQVTNGVLLPVVALCLVLCFEDARARGGAGRLEARLGARRGSTLAPVWKLRRRPVLGARREKP